MELSSIINALSLRVVSGKDNLSNAVTGGYVGDLLSDVMGNGKSGDLWITRQVHQNIVAVASLKDLAGIVLVNNCEPAEDTIQKGVKEGIPIMISEMPGFDVAGKVYNLIKKDHHE
ncbi:MAG: serine kinase [Deltaproteobacteria bacterium]|nr:serine kinase [Deltaproteobacteria bacterium]